MTPPNPCLLVEGWFAGQHGGFLDARWVSGYTVGCQNDGPVLGTLLGTELEHHGFLEDISQIWYIIV